jgi:2-succinyl-5-enolpyruvyl-6-hydroxy-3-cyclohexene-1-carboxylate synthase
MHPTGVWHDPDGVIEELLEADPSRRCAGRPRTEPEWAASWRAAMTRPRARSTPLGSVERRGRRARTRPAGPDRRLHRRVDADRDAETFWPASDEPPRALAHRGANGIDGTVSAAHVAAGRPVVCHLATWLAHDVGALVSVRRLGLEPTFVVVDNGGGAVFDFLAIAGEADVYEGIATPPGVDARGRGGVRARLLRAV